MLSLNQVSLRRGPKLLFENASFQVHAGQRMGVIGANGCGKSSLFAMLLGELEPDAGELELGAAPVIAHVAQESPRDSCSALDYVLDGDAELREIQSVLAAEENSPDGTPGRYAQLYERMQAIDGFSAGARAAKLLHGLGFVGDAVDRPVREFSGGWRMRLNLARALMCRSDILLLDEPTNHLDLPAILWLERWLRRYEGILLLVSHDRDFLDTVCTRIAHIEGNGIRLYNGNYSQFEAQRAAQLAQQQAMFARQQKEIRHLQSYVDRFRYKASKARQAQSRLKMMERLTRIAPAHVDSPFRFHFLEPRSQPQHLLRLEGASAGYDGKPVLSDINLDLSAGARIGLLGVNGAGKSTLVKALAAGSTLLSGERITSRNMKIGYFAQHQLEQLEPDHSAVDHLRGHWPSATESEMRNYLGRFGFSGERIFDPVAPFSGGEKARLVLALMIRQEPNLLLLDEPTNHLDLEMRQALSVALIEYDGALVVISHDRHLLRSVCDELLIVRDGSVEHFPESLDDYPAWLRDQQIREGADHRQPDEEACAPVSRKELRQKEAHRRALLKPLSDRVKRIEKQLAGQRMELEMLDNRLSAGDLYTDAGRKDELTGLVKRQASVRAQIESLEEEWLEASEELEKAR
ncbi:MAG: ATP-binding cassette domain-containing protein [Xanthomonadales bacterium]|nr:ATP-binding cassette domain-containing protein [Xanthomonadales bacterium]NIX14144.1 ATP-binding cassette domain-containing protein [Xanthomonadales bacterium]